MDSLLWYVTSVTDRCILKPIVVKNTRLVAIFATILMLVCRKCLAHSNFFNLSLSGHHWIRIHDIKLAYPIWLVAKFVANCSEFSFHLLFLSFPRKQLVMPFACEKLEYRLQKLQLHPWYFEFGMTGSHNKGNYIIEELVQPKEIQTMKYASLVTRTVGQEWLVTRTTNLSTISLS